MIFPITTGSSHDWNAFEEQSRDRKESVIGVVE
jgi:hypothetical protein